MKNISSNFLPVATIMCFVLAACASTPSAQRVSELGATALIGSWISELDDTKLTVEKNGVYRIEHAADAATTGRWSLEGTAIVFISDSASSACPDIEGAYTPEIVRDTVRFAKLRDECPTRETHMAWPWQRG